MSRGAGCPLNIGGSGGMEIFYIALGRISCNFKGAFIAANISILPIQYPRYLFNGHSIANLSVLYQAGGFSPPSFSARGEAPLPLVPPLVPTPLFYYMYIPACICRMRHEIN